MKKVMGLFKVTDPVDNIVFSISVIEHDSNR